MRRELRLTKVRQSAGGVCYWEGTCSDDEVDLRHTRLDRACFQDFIVNQATHGAPFLCIAHYQEGKVGMIDRLWVDGKQLKNAGTFFQGDPLAAAMFQALVADRARAQPQVRQSVGFYPREVAFEDEVLVYTRGWLEHSATTTIPVNPRTDIGLVLMGAAMTKQDDAAAMVGPQLAADLETREQARRARLQGRCLGVPDLPLGAKLDSILEAMCDRICAAAPIVVFAASAPEPPTPASPRPFLIPPDLEAWLAGTIGEADLSTEPLAGLARELVRRQVRSDASVSDAELPEIFSARPSYAYLQKLADVLRGHVDEETWAAAHRAARGHAGGVAYPYKPGALDVRDYPATPTSRVRDLVPGDKVGQMVRAFVSIWEANDKADIPHRERVGNVIWALEDLKKSLVPLLKRSGAEDVEDLVGMALAELQGYDDERLLELHGRVHREWLLYTLSSSERAYSDSTH